MQERFRKEKESNGDKKNEEELWEEVVKGEDKRGRLYGFGNKSMTTNATRVLETVEASFDNPTRSTATSADSGEKRYTKDEVVDIMAAERKAFAASLVAQDKRHDSEMDEIRNHNKYIIKCFRQLFSRQGMEIPNFEVRQFVLSHLFNVFMQASSRIIIVTINVFTCFIGVLPYGHC